MNAAPSPQRFRFERRALSRTYHFALQNAEACALDLEGVSTEFLVLRPVDAYLAELAQRSAHPRGTTEHVTAGDRALELYRTTGAKTISDALTDLHLQSGSELADQGLRRQDVDTFRHWHARFLHERSPRAIPPRGGRLSTAVRDIRQWMSGADLQTSDPFDR
jgi:hypothetical protein